MTAHTPGPWTFRPGRYGSPHVISWAPGKSYGQVAQINTPSFAELPEAKLADEVEANARLIAQSPRMFEMLKLMVDTGFEVEDEYGGNHWAISEKIRELAREAIAKAEEGKQ